MASEMDELRAEVDALRAMLMAIAPMVMAREGISAARCRQSGEAVAGRIASFEMPGVDATVLEELKGLRAREIVELFSDVASSIPPSSGVVQIPVED